MDSDYYTDEDGITSDSSFVEEQFDQMNMVCITIAFDASDYGSKASRFRWWAVAFDVPLEFKAAVQQNFFEVFLSLKITPYHIDRFLLGRDELSNLCKELPFGGSRPQTKRLRTAEPQWK